MNWVIHAFVLTIFFSLIVIFIGKSLTDEKLAENDRGGID